MRYLSVCSGIEAASVAWHPLGWRPVAFSEIEKFPSAVLARRFPGVPNWGDLNRYKEWPDADVDVLVGGTPCQSFSVAGLRKGLEDPRGNLALVYLGVADRYRPEWVVWENVPGVLSSGGGRDFGAFLGGLGQLGYGFAYRVLDAQFVRTCGLPFAVPQRRRRVFVVGCLGGWQRAAAVLFDAESLRGHPPPRRKAGQRIAGSLAARTTGGGGLGTDFDLDGGLVPAVCNALSALSARDAKGGRAEDNVGIIAVAHALRGEGFDASEDGTGRGTPLVPVAIQERAVSENPNAGPDGAGIRQDGAAYTLEARTVPQAVATPVAFDCKGTEVQFATDGAHLTLRSMGHNHGHQNAGGHAAVAFDLAQITSAANRTRVSAELPASTLNAAGQMHVAQPWAVRRLTPFECERLQGFPDGWTDIPWRGKPGAPDGPRYKALGNSMAVNVMQWIGERIALVEALK